ncbi:topoisomerase B subunit [Beggiatoa sp. PS]|nr:topoisomerase B subunit [Beggiatoa sp. PS]
MGISLKVNMPLELRQAVRKRPGMYFGDIESGGANTVVYEIVANAVDIFLAGLAKKINIEVNNNNIIISDDGPGFPFFKASPQDTSINLVEYYLTNFHNSPTADNHAPHIHILGRGLGLAVLNAASKKLAIESSDGEKLWTQNFGEGMVLSPATHESGNFPTGSKVSITLDPMVFDNHGPNSFELRKIFFEVVHLYPGLSIEFEKECFYSNNGLVDLGYILLKKSASYMGMPKMFRFHYQKKGIEFQVAALGDSKEGTEFRSWVNGCASVENGSHAKGLSSALRLNKWKPEIALIHVIMHDPKFAGPCRDALQMPEVLKVIEEKLTPEIKAFLNAQNA